MSLLKCKIHSSIGESSAPIRILLINPNSTKTFTEELVPVLSKTLPSGDVKIDFLTAPEPSPRSINNNQDGELSTRVCSEYLNLNDPEGRKDILEGYSAVIVACFSKHPLVDSLKTASKALRTQSKKAVVLGILDSAIYSAMNLGGKFGIATTGQQWEPLFDEAVSSMGIQSSRYAGTKGTGFDAISLHGEGPTSALLAASLDLAQNGADTIILGCGGMSAMRENLEESLCEEMGYRIPVIDGVQAAVDMSIGYARMSIALTFQ